GELLARPRQKVSGFLARSGEEWQAYLACDTMSRLATSSPDLGFSLELGPSHAQNSSYSLIDL
ncbi:hypothetical protein A2U01_0096707, partial [Trifolium medium]|nr:hypothetical protein [Trifolium medium]